MVDDSPEAAAPYDASDLRDESGAIRAEIVESVAAAIEGNNRAALARSLEYPEDSAGRRMQTEYIAVRPDTTVGQTIDYMRETADLPDRFYEIYITDRGHRLLGAVALDRLLRAKRPVPISELMHEDLHRARAADDQGEVARLFERYHLIAAPVCDEGERLVGVPS